MFAIWGLLRFGHWLSYLQVSQVSPTTAKGNGCLSLDCLIPGWDLKFGQCGVPFARFPLRFYYTPIRNEWFSQHLPAALCGRAKIVNRWRRRRRWVAVAVGGRSLRGAVKMPFICIRTWVHGDLPRTTLGSVLCIRCTVCHSYPH